MLKVFENIRIESMEEFGFGPNEMKKYKVCKRCYSITSKELEICPVCLSELPECTLYEKYAQNHFSCPKCKTVLSNDCRYCPQCGEHLLY